MKYKPQLMTTVPSFSNISNIDIQVNKKPQNQRYQTHKKHRSNMEMDPSSFLNRLNQTNTDLNTTTYCDPAINSVTTETVDRLNELSLTQNAYNWNKKTVIIKAEPCSMDATDEDIH